MGYLVEIPKLLKLTYRSWPCQLYCIEISVTVVLHLNTATDVRSCVRVNCMYKCVYLLNTNTEHVQSVMIIELKTCASNPCQNGGMCNHKGGDYICRCIGSTGVNCETGEQKGIKISDGCLLFYGKLLFYG